MYTILSTYPPHGSGNVGDKLLEEQVKNLIRRERGIDDFRVEFRTYDFSSTIDELNQSDAIIMPSFAIREPIYPDTYRLAEQLNKIETPLIPLASNWSHYPGDEISNNSLQYTDETVSFLRRLDQQPELRTLTTRDIYTKRILERHGFSDVTLVGDLGWYHDDYLGEPMRTPESIDQIVMTTPHKSHYLDQAEAVLDMLIEEFPSANITVSFHGTLLQHDKEFREIAQDRGANIVLASHDTDNIAFYDDCDLHVGYRLHGHLSFLRRRLPSVLIGEDGRGNGFNATLGVGGFEATERRMGHRSATLVQQAAETLPGRGIRAMLRNHGIAKPHSQLIAPADMTIPNQIRQFLQSEIENQYLTKHCQLV